MTDGEGGRREEGRGRREEGRGKRKGEKRRASEYVGKRRRRLWALGFEVEGGG